MTLTIHLTAEQEEQLRREARRRGVEAHLLAQQLVGRGLNEMGKKTARRSLPRALGLHAGQAMMADDFDAPLPDHFWLGKE